MIHFIIGTIIGILALIAIGGAVFVGLTYLFWLYEEKNSAYKRTRSSSRNPDDTYSGRLALQSDFPPLHFGTELVRIILHEYFSGGLTIFLYPFGIKPRRLPDTPPAAPSGVEPVVYVHGYSMNRSCMMLLSVRIEHEFDVHAYDMVNLRPLYGKIPEQAENFMKRLDEAAAALKVEKFQIVAHSMGGLITRWALAYLDGKRRISRVISLGTPHYGTKIAVLSVSDLGASMHPHGKAPQLLQDAEAKVPENLVPWIAVASRHDQIVMPFENALWEHATANLVVEGLGHLSLLMDSELSFVIGALLQPEPWTEEHLTTIVLPEGGQWRFNGSGDGR